MYDFLTATIIGFGKWRGHGHRRARAQCLTTTPVVNSYDLKNTAPS